MKSKKFSPGVLALLVLAVALAALVLIGLPRTKESRAARDAADPQSSAGAGVLPEAAPAAAGLGGAPTVSAGSTSTGGMGPAPAAAGVAAQRADLSSKKGAKLPGRQTGADYALQDAGMPRNFVLALDEIWVTDHEGKGRAVADADAAREKRLCRRVAITGPHRAAPELPGIGRGGGES